MADTFVSSVDGHTANFNVLYSENRAISGAGNVSIRMLPYGGGAVIQSAGKAPISRTFGLYIASQSDLDDLMHTRGDHGTLTIFEGTYDCTLVSVDASTWWNSGEQLARATWVMDVL